MNKPWLFMYIHFLCLYPLRLAIMINFNISNVGYCHSPNDDATNVYMLNPFFKDWQCFGWSNVAVQFCPDCRVKIAQAMFANCHRIKSRYNKIRASKAVTTIIQFEKICYVRRLYNRIMPELRGQAQSLFLRRSRSKGIMRLYNLRT